ncbi:hypothetical protein P9Z84_29855 [Bacillus cereus]|nr:hypothetical protein [Bacillus cereus]
MNSHNKKDIINISAPYFPHIDLSVFPKVQKPIKIKSSRSLKEVMQVLGLKDSDIFQIQMVWYDPNQEVKK